MPSGSPPNPSNPGNADKADIQVLKEELTVSTLGAGSAQAASAAASVIDSQSQEHGSASSSKKRKLTSKVWDHFERITKGESLSLSFHFVWHVFCAQEWLKSGKNNM
jgi:hypothetical protein